jgi:hypothetical protein
MAGRLRLFGCGLFRRVEFHQQRGKDAGENDEVADHHDIVDDRPLPHHPWETDFLSTLATDHPHTRIHFQGKGDAGGQASVKRTSRIRHRVV